MVIEFKGARQEVVKVVTEKGISQTGVKYMLWVREGPGATKKEHRVRVTDTFQLLEEVIQSRADRMRAEEGN
jgi:hypothetical protein